MKKVSPVLDAIVDVVMAYRPKDKKPKRRKFVRQSQRKAKGCLCDPKRREDQLRINPYCKAKHV